MKPQVNPVSRVGSLTIRPNWRYEALRNPAKYKMQDFTFQPSSGSGCLKRYIQFGVPYEVNFKINPTLRYYLNNLNSEESQTLQRLWKRAFKNSGQRKVSCETDRAFFTANPAWKHEEAVRISDQFLRRMVLHQSQVLFDADIAYALTVASSDEYKEIFRFIGYCIYAKVSDVDIAKRWRIKIRQVEAIRNIFFDFSKFPTDRLANLTYLRQMTFAGVFDEDDFAFYKRAFDLGELGIRAQTDYQGLTDAERDRIREFLGHSVVENTLNIQFTVKSQKDAYAYANTVGNLANYYIKHAELENLRAKTNQINVMTSKIETDMGKNTDVDLTELDRKYMELLREHSLQEVMPQHRSFVELINDQNESK